MNDSPSVVKIASLIGDQARCSMLMTLMSGESLTATELSVEANITKQTASSHLSKLEDAGLICKESQGRHRYFRLADPDIAALLEQMMGVAQRTGSKIRHGPREPALRKARVCYDHLAGDLAVQLYESLLSKNYIRIVTSSPKEKTEIELTKSGRAFFDSINIPVHGPQGSRRPSCRPCLDWSVRRYHVAGVLGNSILDYCFQNKWAKRLDESRVVHFFPSGEKKFRETFGLER